MHKGRFFKYLIDNQQLTCQLHNGYRGCSKLKLIFFFWFFYQNKVSCFRIDNLTGWPGHPCRFKFNTKRVGY
jgi:hypothetical protein